MICFDEAVELIRSVARPLGTETLALEQAAGRVLAKPVFAMIDSPRADVSAMDGFAVREADLAGQPASLRVIGESFPAAGWNGTVEAGTCVRIFTGAPLPSGADRVVIQENVRRDGDHAIICEEPGKARYVRKRGTDFTVGEELLPSGRLLDARAIVAAAAADLGALEVFRRPRLHILSTGDELAEPGAAQARADAIPESVSLGVAALATQWGAETPVRTRLRDNLSAMHEAAASVVKLADVLVVTGGASVGERDFAKAMYEPLGLELIFSKVAIKPGKPVWFGRAADRLIVGLPGNPTSALVTARLLLAPLLAALSGREIECALSWRSLALAHSLGQCGDRETFHRGRFREGAVEILSFQDSSAQKALAEADLLVRQRAASLGAAAGELVDVVEF